MDSAPPWRSHWLRRLRLFINEATCGLYACFNVIIKAAAVIRSRGKYTLVSCLRYVARKQIKSRERIGVISFWQEMEP